VKLKILLTTLLLFLIPNLAKGQQSVKLFFVATAVDVNGTESSFSNEVSATVTSNPLHNIVDLSWIASTSTVAGYNVYWSKVSGGSYQKANVALISGLTFTYTFTFPSPPTMNPPTVP